MYERFVEHRVEEALPERVNDFETAGHVNFLRIRTIGC